MPEGEEHHRVPRPVERRDPVRVRVGVEHVRRPRVDLAPLHHERAARVVAERKKERVADVEPVAVRLTLEVSVDLHAVEREVGERLLARVVDPRLVAPHVLARDDLLGAERARPPDVERVVPVPPARRPAAVHLVRALLPLEEVDDGRLDPRQVRRRAHAHHSMSGCGKSTCRRPTSTPITHLRCENIRAFFRGGAADMTRGELAFGTAAAIFARYYEEGGWDDARATIPYREFLAQFIRTPGAPEDLRSDRGRTAKDLYDETERVVWRRMLELRNARDSDSLVQNAAALRNFGTTGSLRAFVGYVETLARLVDEEVVVVNAVEDNLVPLSLEWAVGFDGPQTLEAFRDWSINLMEMALNRMPNLPREYLKRNGRQVIVRFPDDMVDRGYRGAMDTMARIQSDFARGDMRLIRALSEAPSLQLFGIYLQALVDRDRTERAAPPAPRTWPTLVPIFGTQSIEGNFGWLNFPYSDFGAGYESSDSELGPSYYRPNRIGYSHWEYVGPYADTFTFDDLDAWRRRWE